MRKSLFSVIFLTTVVLSTSDVLPILSIKQLEPELDRHEDKVHDSNLNDRFYNNDISNDIFYKVSIEPSRKAYTPVLIPQKSNVVYVQRENKRQEDIDNDHSNKNDKYDEKGYRKEQWHNYPRQLDRLQKYLYQHHQFDTTINNDPGDVDDVDNNIYEIATNDIQQLNTNEQDMMDAVVAATSPLLILKIRLAYLKNDQNIENDYDNTLPIEILPSDILDNNDAEKMDPIISAVKVKREEKSDNKLSGLSDKTTDRKKNIKKRIFSLWSRLQSLSHKGHELHHRRHLHAFYGFPDDDGSGGGTGTLTAETRASFMRPPGSPLRWG